MGESVQLLLAGYSNPSAQAVTS